MSKERKTKPVRLLAGIIGLDLQQTLDLLENPERLDDEMAKKIKDISWKAHLASETLLDGLSLLGKLMWIAASPENETGDERRLLLETGYFIEELVEMVKITSRAEAEAEFSLRTALECRLKREEYVEIPISNKTIKA